MYLPPQLITAARSGERTPQPGWLSQDARGGHRCPGVIPLGTGCQSPRVSGDRCGEPGLRLCRLFNILYSLYSLLSSPQPLEPGNAEEEPPGSCPALAPRDVGTNSLLAPQGRAWAQGCVPAFISETNSFSFSLHCWGRSGGLRGLAPVQHRSSSRIARWSHPAHPLVALQTFLRDQSLRFFSPGAGQERGRAATRRAALTRT